MATVDSTGELQLEPSDILPRKVAIKTDDPQEVIELIRILNPTITTAEQLAVAIEKVDALRRKCTVDKDNPHIA